MNVIPQYDNNGVRIYAAPPPAKFPETFPTSGPASFAIAYALDRGIRTPYSYAIDFSVDRQLPGNMAINLSYVGSIGHRLLVDFNYTFSKSLDIQLDATSVGQCGLGSVINAWEPYQLYGPSAFDLRNQINANWIWLLPFGRGRLLGHGVGNGINAVIGGWQL